DLFAFVAAYAGDLGVRAGKSPAQREGAGRLAFDLELKRVPFRPERIGDDFTGLTAGLLERQVVALVRQAGLTGRTTLRSFDHRSCRGSRRRDPAWPGAVLGAGPARVAPAELARQAHAQVYAPDYEFLDEGQVRELHSQGVRVLPWTVNEEPDMLRLID